MEWNRIKQLTNDAEEEEDEPEEEEREERAQRRRRVARKEFLVRSQTENGNGNGNGNAHAAKLLQKARNKKVKPTNKNPMLGKANTFMGVGMGMGASSSFMKHRDKCVEK